MSDLAASPEFSNQPPEVFTVEVVKPEVGKIVFSHNVYDPRIGLLKTDRAEKLLQEATGEAIKYRGTGNNKEVFWGEDDKIYLLAISNKDQNFRKQVNFYLKHRNNEAFKNTVAQITDVVVDGTQTVDAGGLTNQIIGMGQERFGMDLVDYLRGGGKLKDEQIDELVEGYREVIEDTGYPHSDLLFGDDYYNFHNIRIDLSTGKLKLIDYHGTDIFRLDNKKYSPQKIDTYRKVVQTHPDRLAKALKSIDPRILRILK